MLAEQEGPSVQGQHSFLGWKRKWPSDIHILSTFHKTMYEMPHTSSLMPSSSMTRHPLQQTLQPDSKHQLSTFSIYSAVSTQCQVYRGQKMNRSRELQDLHFTYPPVLCI